MCTSVAEGRRRRLNRLSAGECPAGGFVWDGANCRRPAPSSPRRGSMSSAALRRRVGRCGRPSPCAPGPRERPEASAALPSLLRGYRWQPRPRGVPVVWPAGRSLFRAGIGAAVPLPSWARRRGRGDRPEWSEGFAPRAPKRAEVARRRLKNTQMHVAGDGPEPTPESERIRAAAFAAVRAWRDAEGFDAALLYGSAAWGDASEGSDGDVMLLFDRDGVWEDVVRVHEPASGLHFDVVRASWAAFERGLAGGWWLPRLAAGVILLDFGHLARLAMEVEAATLNNL